MDIFKAVINLKEGTVQLEGSQEFVEKYLDKYDSIIGKMQALPSVATVTTKNDKVKNEEQPTSKRTRKVKSIAGPTCAEKIRELISEGYFKEPKTTAAISDYLTKQKGYVNTTKDVSANLKGMFDRGQIKRKKEGNAFKYYVNV